MKNDEKERTKQCKMMKNREKRETWWTIEENTMKNDEQERKNNETRLKIWKKNNENDEK